MHPRRGSPIRIPPFLVCFDRKRFSKKRRGQVNGKSGVIPARTRHCNPDEAEDPRVLNGPGRAAEEEGEPGDRPDGEKGGDSRCSNSHLGMPHPSVKAWRLLVACPRERVSKGRLSLFFVRREPPSWRQRHQGRLEVQKGAGLNRGFPEQRAALAMPPKA